MPYDKYETVIGLEVHVQLSTNSKAFCNDNTTFGADANTQVSPISLAHPGTLPVVNANQIEYATRLGLALGSSINQNSAFDRKNYFYADLPKGYQITQDRSPICIGGEMEVIVDGKLKTIRIHHIHMEEDAGKSIHDTGDAYSNIDLNRAGVPLLEIVTEPDMRSAEEVDVFMTNMRQLVRYIGVSDGNMEQGSMRCDCNVSVRLKGATEYGTRCEIKNVNSMRYAKRAIAYEVKRQIDLIEAGGKIEQQTLNFDPASGVTSPIRDKEDAHDYRYFPEPDMPPIILSDEYVERVKKSIPTLPKVLKQQFMGELGLSDYDASLLTEEKQVADYFLALAEQTDDPKGLANLLINKVIPHCKAEQIDLEDYPLQATTILDFLKLIKTGKVSNAMAYQKLLPALLDQTDSQPVELAQKMNLIQSSDTDFLTSLIDEVLAAQAEKVQIYKKGKKGLLGFFMKEVMKRSKGKADPKLANKMLREKLEE
ncbi:MAG: Asp-tRNA(Asn)/Glu-tRNA(Gln) amidotransferase subunit GatB [Bacteroidota bacterium]